MTVPCGPWMTSFGTPWVPWTRHARAVVPVVTRSVSLPTLAALANGRVGW